MDQRPQPAVCAATGEAGLGSAGERRWFALIFSALAAISLIPIWTVRFHPLGDLPNHMAAVAVLHYLRDAPYDFARYYQLQLSPVPYWVYYGLLHGLAFPLGLDLGNRVVLSLYVLGIPLGTLWLARRFDRSPWLALFAFPLVWNYNFAVGFVTYCMGLLLSLCALALFDRYCERPTARRGLLAAVAGALTFFGHLLSWGLYLGTAGLVGLLHRGLTPRRLAGRLMVWGTSLATGLLVIRSGTALHMGKIGNGFQGAYTPRLDLLRLVPNYVLDVYTSHDDELVWGLALLAWLGLWLTQWLGVSRPPGTASWPQRLQLHRFRAAACFLVPAVAYFVLPRSVLRPAYWWGVNIRYPAAAAVLGALCIAGPIRGWRRWLLVPAACAGIGMVGITQVHWQRMNRMLDGLAELGRVPPQGARVLVLTFPPWSEPAMAPYHFVTAANALYQAYHGGYNPTNFDDGFPLRYRQRFPAPHWARPEEFSWERHAPYYDYVLALNVEAGGLFGGHAGEVRLEGSAGKWRLWRLPGPRVDVSPGPVYPGGWALDPAWRPQPAKR